MWAHTYSFPSSSFEIWTQAHDGPLKMEGMGYVFYRRPEPQRGRGRGRGGGEGGEGGGEGGGGRGGGRGPRNSE